MSKKGISIFLFMVVVMMMILHVDSAHEVYQYVRKRPSNTMNKYCGKNLANALHLLCNGVYNSMFKRQDQSVNEDSYSPEDDNPYPFRSRERAYDVMNGYGRSRFRRISRGVHDECCAKPCTIEELSSYCAA